jgi:hypothetical protein
MILFTLSSQISFNGQIQEVGVALNTASLEACRQAYSQTITEPSWLFATTKHAWCIGDDFTVSLVD